MLRYDRRLCFSARGPVTLRGGLRWFAALACLMICGCSDASRDERRADGEPAKSAAATVNAILDRVVKAYRDAKSYSDSGTIIMQISDSTGEGSQEFDAHVAFQRPNLLRIEHQPAEPQQSGQQTAHVLVVADGKKIFARAEGYGNQVVVVEEPATIDLPALYRIEAFKAPNGMLLLPYGIAGTSIVLDLLTSQTPMEGLDRAKAHVLAPGEIDGQSYDRVEFATDAGPLTFWIDRETSVVRRAQFPTEPLRQTLLPEGSGSLKLTAEFIDAKLNPTLPPERFTWVKSEGEHDVRHLVEPPNPEEAPSKLLGNALPDFSFVNAAGEKQTPQALSGKITVIDFWATWCTPCKQSMPGVDAVRKKYAGNDKVRFLAMSVDYPDTSNDDIVALLKQLKVDPPWARTLPKNADELTEFDQRLGFRGIPAMVILNAEGRVQFVRVGMDPEIEQLLPQLIDDLLARKDLALKTKEAWEARQRQYQLDLAAASVEATTTTIEIPRAKIAERSEPKKFKLTQRWTAEAVKAPGNLLVIETKDAAPRIFVIDQPHEIVELDAKGKQVARRQDLVAGQPPFTFLRTAVGGDGKRLFVVGAIGQEQFHVFDDQWRRILSYPELGSAQIYDVLPADLDGDGKLELNIGYFGAGVHSVSLDGKRLWRNRTIENVNSLAATGPDAQRKRRLLCTHLRGTIVPIRSDGVADAPISDAGHAVLRIAAADLDGDGQEEYCGLVVDSSGHRTVVGFHIAQHGGEVLWQQEIPSGEPEHAIDQLGTAHLVAGQSGQWLVAAADGSVHIIAHDGSWHEEFNSGAPLTGLGAATIDGQPVLLLAHPDKLIALSVEKKP